MGAPSDQIDGLLSAIRVAADDVEAARQTLYETVRRARDAGASYAAIGETLGVSRQAAWERFAKNVTDVT